MFTFAKQLGVVSLSGMMALSFMVPAAQAQRRGGMAARPMSQPRPIVQTQRPGGIAARPMSRPIVQRPGGIAARPVSRPKPVVPRPGGVAARPSSQPKPLVQAQRPGAMPATLATRPGLPGKPTPGSLQSSNPSPIFLPPQIDGTPFRCWDRDCCWDRDRCWDRDCWWRHCRHYWPYDQRTDNNTNNNNSGGGSSSSSSSGGSSSGGSDDGGSALRTYADLLRQQQAEAERLRRELSEKRRRDSDEKESDRTPRGGSAQALPSPNRAPVAEIRSAKALNDILDHLTALQDRGYSTPFVGLDKGVLEQINVATVSGGNVGLLKNKGQLDWPLAFQGNEFQPERTLLNGVSEKAVKQATSRGRVDRDLLITLDGGTEQLEAKLKEQAIDLSPADYFAAKGFISNLEDARKALTQPDVADYFNHTYAATGSTVGRLVKNMAAQDLRFAPATPGTEEAYQKLYRALVTCILAYQS